MNGFRNLYKVFRETRKAAREQATVAVVGDDSATIERLSALIGAQRDMRGAEIILTISDNKLSLSGKGVDDAIEVGLEEGTDEDFERRIVPRIVRALDDDYTVPLAKAYPVFREAVCEELIRQNARQNAVIGALPVPGADMPVMTANQGRMVLLIAAAYGEELSFQRARELVGVLAMGFGLRAVSRQVIKLIPFGGWAAAAAIGYAGTIAMGRATILYFERGGQKIGAQEMENIQKRAASEAKDFVARLRRKRG